MSATEDTRNIYCDPVVPNEGEYPLTRIILRIPHKVVAKRYDLVPAKANLKKGDYISWDAKFVSGKLLGVGGARVRPCTSFIILGRFRAPPTPNTQGPLLKTWGRSGRLRVLSRAGRGTSLKRRPRPA